MLPAATAVAPGDAAPVPPRSLGAVAWGPAADPDALCDAIEAAHLTGPGAREGAARLLADIPLAEAEIAAAREALERTWPQP